MSYQVLARKWRPRHFKEMVGQDYVLRTLINALDHQRLHHAYLFTGTRGVGKTTIARIFAKCLNCETGVTSVPCDQCNACIAINTGKFLDLYEIDAASRTKVEDTRELLDNVPYPPTQGRYKVYLIDEVHMLSGHSFNALLKTLEEPPQHVIFLLATTDPKRLPITVLSRCLPFQLKRISADKIAQHLIHICTQENVSFEPAALSLLAQAADGSLRDALSLLDQAIAFCNNAINTEDVQHLLGAIEKTVIYSLLAALIQRDAKQLIEYTRQLTEFAPDFNQVLADILSVLHQISLLQAVPDLPTEDDFIKQCAKDMAPEDVQLYYQIGLIGQRDLPFAPTPQQGFEMVMLRMLAFCPAALDLDLSPITSTLSGSISSAPIKTPAIPQPATSPPDHPTKWVDILPKLGLTGLAFALASNCTLVSKNNNHITLALTKAHEPMFNKKLEQRFEQALSTYYHEPTRLTIQITDSSILTPAIQKQQDQALKNNNAIESIQNDPHVQKIIDTFGATLDVDSITPL